MEADTIENLKLRVVNHQVHYLKAGSGLPVVLVHGGASDSRDWTATIDALSHRYSLYAPDLIGYGLSDNFKSGYYLSDFVDSTLEFIHTLGLNSPVLVGHSLGGRICMEIALRHPEMVRKLVLVDAAGFGRITLWGGIPSTAAWATRKLLRQPQPYPAFLTEDGENNGWLCLDELPGLKVHTLIVWKRYDPYLPLALARKAKKLIPDVRLTVLPGYGHTPQVQNRDSFNSLLLDFLDHD